MSKMQHLKKFNESSSNDESLKKLVRQILDACKIDVDLVEESDPEFIGYISSMIKDWKENEN